MKRFAILFLASTAIVAHVPAHAADAIPDGRIYTSVTEADLAALVTAEGHTVSETHTFEVPSVSGKTPDGLFFDLVGSLCDASGGTSCDAVMMQIRYDADDKVTTDNINTANYEEAGVASWWDKEGKTVGFTRYVLLEGGVTHMNMRMNLRALLEFEPTARGYVWPE